MMTDEFEPETILGHVMPAHDFALHAEQSNCFCQPVLCTWKEAKIIYGFEGPESDERIIFHKKMMEFPH